MTVLKNAMTVDVEDYFQVSAFEKHVSKEDWNRMPQRVEQNTNRILDMFASAGIQATFFTLGWVAERYPILVRRIVDEGHELASHGYEHIRVINQKPEDFLADVTKTKKLLEDIGGKEVVGYRAASYSICKTNMWAFDELLEAGYRYSSSVYPIKHDLYGMPDAPRFEFKPRGEDGIKEIPVTTIKAFGKTLPCGGGGFFRLYPYSVSRWALNHINKKEQQPGMFYFHPWEIDPNQPKQKGLGFKTKFRHYLNLSKMEQRLNFLLRDFQWGRMDEVFGID